MEMELSTLACCLADLTVWSLVGKATKSRRRKRVKERIDGT